MRSHSQGGHNPLRTQTPVAQMVVNYRIVIASGIQYFSATASGVAGHAHLLKEKAPQLMFPGYRRVGSPLTGVNWPDKSELNLWAEYAFS